MKSHIALLAIGIISSTTYSAEPLKDPKLRDEDISGLSITTKIEKQADSKYKYTYTISNPAYSLDDILSFYLDIECPNMPNVGEQHTDDAGYTRESNSSADGRHVPLQSSIDGLSQKMASITRDNIFMTIVSIQPGQTRNIVIVSPNKPGYLHFKTTVTSADESAYDYLDESGENWKYPMDDMPWYEDWQVHGIVKGPACQENAATPLTRPIFNGQRMPLEPRDTDRLLRYETKGSRNRWHESAGVSEVKIRIHYDFLIDAASFSAQINGRDISSTFHPDDKAGVYEDIVLPLEGAITKLRFEVCDRYGKISDGSFNPDKCDVDLFEIRRPLQ